MPVRPRSYICISHLPHDPDLLHEKAASRTGKTGSVAGSHRQILTRAAAADDVHRRQLIAPQLRDVSEVQHPRQALLRNANGERLDLAGPQWHDAVMDGRQREAPDTIEETSHGDNSHFTAATTVRAILTALCAV